MATLNEFLEKALKNVKLDEADFAKGKSAQSLAEYIDKMMDNWKGRLQRAKSIGNYAGAVNTIVRDGINDLERIKKQMEHISKTGSEK